MKNKLISTIMLVALACVAIIGDFNMQAEVFAAEKSATLVDTKVSFDGKEPVIIQSYRIDGFNYVRVAEIAQYIGMGVQPAYHEVGVLIQPTMPYTSGGIEKITEPNIAVQLTTGTVFYDGMRYENAGCFNHQNRYYYKLADLIAASEYALGRNISFAKDEANSAYYREPTTKAFVSFDIGWNAETSTVTVSRSTTDLRKIFTEARASKGLRYNDVSPENIVTTVEPPKEEATVFTPQSELLNAPLVGTVPANILIDKGKGAYNTDGDINVENIYEAYRTTVKASNHEDFFGQCTWYASGRLYETTGTNILEAPNRIIGLGLYSWVDEAMSGKYTDIMGTTDLSKIVPRSIAVWAGHVVFIEYVEYDNVGNPTEVYYTEANGGHDGVNYEKGVYYPDFDCKVKVKGYSDFIRYKSNGNALIGYIMSK